MRIHLIAIALLGALCAGCGAGNVGTTNSLGLADGLVNGTRSPAQNGLSVHLAARLINRARAHAAWRRARGSWIKKSQCGSSVIYSSDYATNTIDIFPQNSTDEGPCGQLTVKKPPLATPQGLFVDSNGDLWVTNSYEHEIDELAPLSKKVLRTLYDTLGEPVSVIVDPNTGSVYAGNLEGHDNGPGGVIAFDNGNDTPTRQLTDSNLTNAYFVAVDNGSNVYATLTTPSGQGAVHEWLGGTGNAVDLGISLGFPGGIETTQNGALLICDQGIPACGDVEPGTTSLANEFALNDYDPVNASLDAGEDTAFTPDDFEDIIYAWQYPGPDSNPLYEKTVGIPNSLYVAAYPAAPIGSPFNESHKQLHRPRKGGTRL